jgi:hypothetical protein
MYESGDMMHNAAAKLHVLFNLSLAFAMSALIVSGLHTLWHLPLAAMIPLVVLLAFVLLYANALLQGKRMGQRWQRQMRERGRRRRPDGHGWGGDDDDGRGGLAGERVPRQPLPPTLSARASAAPDEHDDYWQPRR